MTEKQIWKCDNCTPPCYLVLNDTPTPTECPFDRDTVSDWRRQTQEIDIVDTEEQQG